jgi:molecular chaperone GrpE
MDKHREHGKTKEKVPHEEKESAVKQKLDLTDEALEKKMKDEKASEERRSEERRRAYRREADRTADEQRTNAIKDNQKLREEMNALKDTMLRRQADFENYKKRIAKQQGEVRKMAFRDIARDIIQINDDLLRAIEASESMPDKSSGESHASFVKGVSMISQRIEEALKKYGVVEIDAMNQEFDPNLHEAVEIEMSDGVEFDMVTKVYQKGFRIDDLVVRSAKVKVTKQNRPPAEPAPASEGNKEGGDEETVH